MDLCLGVFLRANPGAAGNASVYKIVARYFFGSIDRRFFMFDMRINVQTQ